MHIKSINFRHVVFIIINAVKLKLFRGKLTPEHVKLKRNILWDIIELGWKEVNITLNGNKINLQASLIIPLRDKLKIRCIVKLEPLLFFKLC